MATTAEDCQRIRNAVRENNALLAVCHVMRYTPYSRKIHEIVRSGYDVKHHENADCLCEMSLCTESARALDDH